MRKLLFVLVLLACTAPHAAKPMAVSITLADGRAVDLAPSTLALVPRETAAGTSHGKISSYEGYDLRTVLSAVGVTPVEKLRGKQLSTLVTVTAADGYKVVFGLAELDRTLGDTLVLLVDRENGQPLLASDGPWRLVVPSDQRSARWVRQVTSIRMSAHPAAGG